jgi:hypothetical protein
MVRALLVPVEGKLEEVEVTDLTSIGSLLGDSVLVETLPMPIRGAIAYGDENAKVLIEPLPPNPRATTILFPDPEGWRRHRDEEVARFQEWGAVVSMSPDDSKEPYIAGPIVVCGYDEVLAERRPLGGRAEAWVRLVDLRASEG